MKTKLFKTSTESLEFNHITEAMNYARFHNITRFMVLLSDDTGLSLYDSVRCRWSFPANEITASISIRSLLA